MSDPFVAKGQATQEIMEATGYGRIVIEKKMVELETRGLIAFEDDPGDSRKKLIRQSHVQIVIASLKKS